MCETKRSRVDVFDFSEWMDLTKGSSHVSSSSSSRCSIRYHRMSLVNFMILMMMMMFCVKEARSKTVHVLPSGIQISHRSGGSDCEHANRVQDGDYVRVQFEGFAEQMASSQDEPGATPFGMTLFGSSRGGPPFGFVVGRHETFADWDEGLVGLCKGMSGVIHLPSLRVRNPRFAKDNPVLFGDDDYTDAQLRVDVEIVDLFAVKPTRDDTATVMESEDSSPSFLNTGLNMNEDSKLLTRGRKREEREEEERNIFREIDDGGLRDGFLTREEVRLFFANERLEITPEYLEAIFRHEDKNKDRMISWHEFSGAKGTFPPLNFGLRL